MPLAVLPAPPLTVDCSPIALFWRARLKELFPEIEEVGGEHMENGQPMETTYDSPRAYCTLAEQELGLTTYPIDETIKATGDSLVQLGLLSEASRGS